MVSLLLHSTIAPLHCWCSAASATRGPPFWSAPGSCDAFYVLPPPPPPPAQYGRGVYGVVGGRLQSIGATHPALHVTSCLTPARNACDFSSEPLWRGIRLLRRAVITAAAGAPPSLCRASVTLVLAGVHVWGSYKRPPLTQPLLPHFPVISLQLSTSLQVQALSSRKSFTRFTHILPRHPWFCICWPFTFFFLFSFLFSPSFIFRFPFFMSSHDYIVHSIHIHLYYFFFHIFHLIFVHSFT